MVCLLDSLLLEGPKFGLDKHYFGFKSQINRNKQTAKVKNQIASTLK